MNKYKNWVLEAESIPGYSPTEYMYMKDMLELADAGWKSKSNVLALQGNSHHPHNGGIGREASAGDSWSTGIMEDF